MEQIEVRSRGHRDMVAITGEIERVVRSSGVADGLCHVFVPHTTAAVVVNENADPDVARDLVAAYEAMVPQVRFEHAEGNSDAHLLATLLGESVVLPVEGGGLRLGRWQGVFLVELDGPRTRQVWIGIR